MGAYRSGVASRGGCNLSIEIAVVGGGPAALVTCHYLREAGFDPYILERGQEVAYAWKIRPARLRLTTPWSVNRLPRLRPSARLSDFPTTAEWAFYLQRYAISEGFKVLLQHEVESIEPAANGWLISTQRRNVTARVVIVATGEDRVPTMPDVPGLEEHRCPLVHSSALDMSVPRRSSVLVVGTGTSGCEVAARLAERGNRVQISVRTIPVILPRRCLSVSTGGLGYFATFCPDGLVDLVGRAVERLTFGPIDWGISASQHRLSERRWRRYAPTIDQGFVKALRAGLVTPVPAVRRFYESSVELSDGSSVKPDLTVAATGYKPALGQYLKVRGVLDATGRPQEPEKLRALAPGLYFVGLRPRTRSLHQAIRWEGRRVARDVREYLTP